MKSLHFHCADVCFVTNPRTSRGFALCGDAPDAQRHNAPCGGAVSCIQNHHASRHRKTATRSVNERPGQPTSFGGGTRPASPHSRGCSTGPLMLASPSVPPRVSQCVLRCGLYFYPSSDPQCMPPCGGGPRWEISALGDYRAKLGVVRAPASLPRNQCTVLMTSTIGMY